MFARRNICTSGKTFAFHFLSPFHFHFIAISNGIFVRLSIHSSNAISTWHAVKRYEQRTRGAIFLSGSHSYRCRSYFNTVDVISEIFYSSGASNRWLRNWHEKVSTTSLQSFAFSPFLIVKLTASPNFNWFSIYSFDLRFY